MNDILSKLESKLKEYENVVEQKRNEGLLSKSTAETYITHSQNFVRWCKGDFIPGERNKNHD